MPVGPMNLVGSSDEQSLYERLIIEAIQIHGQDFKYIPRNIVRRDDLYGEDTGTRFDNGYDIEMYVENLEGYEGQELFQKFGVEIRDEGTLVVSRSRWDEIVGTPESQTRPNEGDLVYVPFSKSLFEITFVEHEEPFYQINQIPIYKLRVSLFEYNDEQIDVDGVSTVDIESTTAQVLTLSTAGSYTVGETVTQTQTVGVVTGEVLYSNGTELRVGHVTSDTADFNIFEPGFNVVGGTSAEDHAVASVADYVDTFESNDTVETEADVVIEFDPSNPYGDF